MPDVGHEVHFYEEYLRKCPLFCVLASVGSRSWKSDKSDIEDLVERVRRIKNLPDDVPFPGFFVVRNSAAYLPKHFLLFHRPFATCDSHMCFWDLAVMAV
jgi:hypothetical protein